MNETSLEFDPEKLKKHWEGGIEVLKGTSIYNPLSGDYVPVNPSAIPPNPPPDLMQPVSNSIDARRSHVQILVNNGNMTQQQATGITNFFGL